MSIGMKKLQTVGDEAFGFKVRQIRELQDVPGRMWRMEFVKNGADLVWIETEDRNKTFAITFRTQPEDDTGVAHIMEHSVLCGSEKFPIKDPFNELHKSSLATHLNAYTGAACTYYPAASCNAQDLLNLAEVYLDAVFAPLAVKNDWAMPQERNIVFNEMKGAMSSPSEHAWHEMAKLLFPSNVYGRNSGGDPAVIPTLTAEKYREFYDRFYHPSNALVFLYGKIDLAPMLKLVESYLGRYPRRAIPPHMPFQPPVVAEKTIEYSCDVAVNRTRLCEGWAFGTWRDYEKVAAMNIVCSILADFNHAPLTKALLDAGVCDEFYMMCNCRYQNQITATFVNVHDGTIDEARRIFRETLGRLVREGFDRERIAARIDKLEFLLRERDTSQVGMFLFDWLRAYWCHGGDLTELVEYLARIESLRRLNGTGYYERLAAEIILENSHHATLVMKPTTAPRAELPSPPEPPAKAPEDNPADLAKIPRLRLADIPEKDDNTKWTVDEVDGVEVVHSHVAANGITYVHLAFSVGDLEDEEKMDLPLLADALGLVATSVHDANGIRHELDSRLGGFGAGVHAHEKDTCLTVSLSVLMSRSADALRLVREVLTGSDFSAEHDIADFSRQSAIGFEDELHSGGEAIAGVYASRGHSAEARDAVLIGGLPQYWRRKGAAHVDLAALASKVFVRSRLTASVANSPGADFARELVSIFPAGTPKGARRLAASVAGTDLSCAVPTKAQGAATAMCTHLPDGVPYSGAFAVACDMFSRDFLWNEIRVKGGAYHVSVNLSRDGKIKFMSWNDPRPADTFAVYARCGEALREFVKSGRSFESYQVSRIGSELNLSVSVEAALPLVKHLEGYTDADERQARSEVLHMTADDLLRFADFVGRGPDDTSFFAEIWPFLRN
ncbi:MAG: insulinase family protein [Kiritimatiellae bacterium]|nr:insulinase family protein [Kiritimatiellia bacterium]